MAVDALKACYTKNPPIPCLVDAALNNGDDDDKEKKKDNHKDNIKEKSKGNKDGGHGHSHQSKRTVSAFMNSLINHKNLTEITEVDGPNSQ